MAIIPAHAPAPRRKRGVSCASSARGKLKCGACQARNPLSSMAIIWKPKIALLKIIPEFSTTQFDDHILCMCKNDDT